MIILWFGESASVHTRHFTIWRIYWRNRWTPFARLRKV